ncbi:prolipoprotein diacylglyceryl transferase [Olsenella sp. An290]|uniref:prolipoprotein diacylglyceryl transferase n=1 Tax=Olsenella sp. An290 TaxID=1965625 RepID=UPI000B3A723F|nr:prolipoprotein diacylglyceryl transferase [Olsenella sp. An290]OUO35939.1 prolipoprotein diacylglyceryl transferase [Olsenella sp. An290]
MFLNELYHALDPVAFSLGPFTVRWYALAYLAGFVLAGVVMWRTQRRWRLGLSVDDVFSIMMGIVFGIIVGARLFYVLFYGAGYYLENPLEIIMLSHGGMSFHGGLVGAVVGGSLVCRHYGISVASVCDLGVIGAPLGLFFGRCANFVNGELWGKETDLPWGVMFETGGAVYRHPSQLYEAVLEGLVIFAVLYALSRRVPPRPQGTFTGWFLTLYGVFRFLIEFVRVPDAQLGYLFGPITMGQLLSLPLVLLGVGILVAAHRLGRPQRGYLDGPRA